MLAPFTFTVRSERLIALGRLGFALLALAATALDPTQPNAYEHISYGLLGLYLLWSVFALWLSRRWICLAPASAVLIHAIDVVSIAILMALTEGQTSPSLVFLTFVLLAAMLRWSWPSILTTAVVVLIIFIGFSTVLSEQIALSNLAIRSGYLAIIAIMLGFIAASQEKLRNDFARLSGPQVPITALELPVSQLLSYVATVFRARRTLLVWGETEEPWVQVGFWSDGRTQITRETPESLRGTVAPELQERAFVSWDTADTAATLVFQNAVGFTNWSGVPLHEDFRTRFSIRSVISAPLPAESIAGRLFVLDAPAATAEHVLAAQVVAEQVASRFDLQALMQRLRVLSATEERMRLARDLHDGVLQFLAGAALQIDAARRQMERGADKAQQQLASLQQAFVAEQRILREFVDQLKPTGTRQPEGDEDLEAALHPLLDVLQQRWDLVVSCTIEPEGAQVPASVCRHLRHLISEAAANAKRHGNARTLDVSIRLEDEMLRLGLTDDGIGFPFEGHIESTTLMANNLGPVMLRERVRGLGGHMVVESSKQGARIEISLPLKRNGMNHADTHRPR